MCVIFSSDSIPWLIWCSTNCCKFLHMCYIMLGFGFVSVTLGVFFFQSLYYCTLWRKSKWSPMALLFIIVYLSFMYRDKTWAWLWYRNSNPFRIFFLLYMLLREGYTLLSCQNMWYVAGSKDFSGKRAIVGCFCLFCILNTVYTFFNSCTCKMVPVSVILSYLMF